MTAPDKWMDIAEFREQGYLQELNRGFLHPLGLALVVQINDDGTEELMGIWDCRNDPEGIIYGEVDPDKARHVSTERVTRQLAREAALGYWQQPSPPFREDKK